MSTETNKIKTLSTYIDLDKNSKNNLIDAITVEHRSGNKKRDYLFVNKNQCKHIPCSPTAMSKMSKQLAKKIDADLNKDDNVAIIGFAETATAIAEVIANSIKNTKSVYLIKTTRETMYAATEVVEFLEEHSHATEQKLLTWDNPSVNNDAFDINKFNKIIFVDDEITTGQTILNCITKLNKQILYHRYQRYAFYVASICNWQNDESKERFEERNIKTYSLISGKIKDKEQKMKFNEDDLVKDNENNKKAIFDTFNATQIEFKPFTETFGRNLFFRNRLGHWIDDKSKRQDKMVLKMLINSLEPYINRKVTSIRVIGTEEFMYLPIKLGMKLEKLGYKVICHSTTRSKIDILKIEDKKISTDILEQKTIVNRYNIDSPYDETRQTYLYNTNTYTDIVIVMTDAIDGAIEKFMVNIPNIIQYKPKNIIFIQV